MERPDRSTAETAVIVMAGGASSIEFPTFDEAVRTFLAMEQSLQCNAGIKTASGRIYSEGDIRRLARAG